MKTKNPESVFFKNKYFLFLLLLTLGMSASPKILLYELHWSHFCEKVRFALNYKKLDWKPVQVDPLSFKQVKHLKGIRKLTPLLEDLSTGKVLSGKPLFLFFLLFSLTFL